MLVKQRTSFSLALVCAATFILGACGGQTPEGQNDPSESSHTESDAYRAGDSDEAWARVLSPEGDRTEQVGAGWENFVDSVARSSFARRSAGIEFWREYPNDLRKYDWLILEANMPVDYIYYRYLSDAPNELAELGGGYGPKGEWLEQYAEFRRAFWESGDVTDYQRRLLWFGELEQSFLAIHAGREIYSSVFEKPKLADEIIAFFERFPEAAGELDLIPHAAVTSRLAQLTVAQPGVLFDCSEKSYLSFQSKVRATGNSIADHIIASDPIDTSDCDSDAFRGERKKPRWEDLFTSGEIFDTSTKIGSYIAQYKTLINWRWIRHNGKQLFNQDPDYENVERWLTLTSSVPIQFYPVDPAEAVKSNVETNGLQLVEANSEAQKAWNEKRERIREWYWVHPNTNSERRALIESLEFAVEGFERRRQWYSRQSKLDVDAFVREVDDYRSRYGSVEPILRTILSVVNNYPEYGLGQDEVESALIGIIGEFDTAADQTLSARLKEVQKQPRLMDFQLEALDGSPMRVSDFRGSILLIDHWSTTCASCIEAMPGIHETYVEYRDRGFEVLSVAYDASTRKSRVLRLKTEMGLEWTTANGEPYLDSIWGEFGFIGVPQYTLLTREGRFFAGTAEVDGGRGLPALLDEILASETQ